MKYSLKIFKALADRNRLRILKILQHKDGSCVCEIVEVLGIVQSTTSRHLSLLEEADLIFSVKEGKWVNYHLNRKNSCEAVRQVLDLLETWMENDSQVAKDRETIDRCDRNVLCCRCS